jgi:mediator of RNA polymerase II transcription subunit 23
MALPISGADVGNALYDIILKGLIKIPRDKVFAWMNAIGIVVTALPECYWIVLHDRVLEAIHDPHLVEPSPCCDPFQLLNFSAGHQVMGEVRCGYVLALCHAVWVHASIGQLSLLTTFMREKLKPIMKTEEQFLFVCHLIGPFLQRFHIERTRCMLEVTLEFYEMLEIIDRSVSHLRFLDPISDFLYHIKYMFVGDGVKGEVEKVIRSLRPALQLRLRFISHHSRDENTPVNPQQLPVATAS